MLGSMTKNFYHGNFQASWYTTAFFVLPIILHYWAIYLFFLRLSDELLKELGLKWLIILLSGGACSIEKDFDISCIYTGLLVYD